MADKPQSLQDYFLNSIRRAKSPLTLFLVKGVKLQGVVTWFDAFSLLLRRDSSSQLVYKHAISTIVPARTPSDLLNDPVPAGGVGKAGLQDVFLSAAEREGQGMTIFLVNGVMIQGSVAGFDQFSLLLRRGEQAQLVYKHAVSTIQSDQPLDLARQQSES